MKKEPKFRSEDEFIEHILSYKPIRNQKNFSHFVFESVGEKLHLNRWLLVQDCKGELKIKFYNYVPKAKVIAYANHRRVV